MLGIIFVTWVGSLEAAVPGAWEKFTSAKNADSWNVYKWGQATPIAPNWDSTPNWEHIWYRHTGDAVVEFSADELTAGGAYVGDFRAANVDSVTVDLYIQDLAKIDAIYCMIYTRGPDGQMHWYYAEPYTQADFTANGWQEYVRFGMEETWTHYDGPTPVTMVPDEQFLRSVQAVSISFFPVRNLTSSVELGIDNFVLEPKMILPKLEVSHTAADFRIAYTPAPGLSTDLQKMSASAPFTWSDVSGHTFITGPALHVFTTPLTQPVGIYRVAVFPSYAPIHIN